MMLVSMTVTPSMTPQTKFTANATPITETMWSGVISPTELRRPIETTAIHTA